MASKAAVYKGTGRYKIFGYSTLPLLLISTSVP
jgi:hypothetical protein